MEGSKGSQKRQVVQTGATHSDGEGYHYFPWFCFNIFSFVNRRQSRTNWVLPLPFCFTHTKTRFVFSSFFFRRTPTDTIHVFLLVVQGSAEKQHTHTHVAKQNDGIGAVQGGRSSSSWLKRPNARRLNGGLSGSGTAGCERFVWRRYPPIK